MLLGDCPVLFAAMLEQLDPAIHDMRGLLPGEPGQAWLRASILKPSKTSQEMAMVLAMVVRNAMEDFHCRHLNDEQMKELNPIMRNAIYTGLQAFRHYGRSTGARKMRAGNVR